MKFLSNKRFLLCAYFILVIFQIRISNIRLAYEFSAAEKDLQITRMNEYPPSAARLGYILEAKNEVQILRRLEDNFFDAIDPRQYFPARLPNIFSIFVLIGLYILVLERNKRKLWFYGFLVSIVTLTILGPYAKYGPILMYPFFVYFGVVSINNTILLLVKKHKTV